MGRAIVRQPAVFLFDEPLSNLDAALRVQMRSEIRGLHERLGSTSIFVTHDQVEAMTMADRIVVMRAGRLEQAGPPLELYDRPANAFVAGFIGSPAMNLMQGVAAGAEVRLGPDMVLALGWSGQWAGAVRHQARASGSGAGWHAGGAGGQGDGGGKHRHGDVCGRSGRRSAGSRAVFRPARSASVAM